MPDKMSMFLLLIDRYIRGTLSEEESRMLLDELKKNDRLLEVLQKNRAVHILLHEKFKIDQESKLASLVPVSEEEEVCSDGFADTDAIDQLIRSERNARPVRPVIIPQEPPLKTKSLWEYFPWKKKKKQSNRSKPETTKPKSEKEKRPESWWPFMIRLGIFIAFISWLTLQGYHNRFVPEEHFIPLVKIAETIDAVWEENAEQYKRGQEIGVNELALKSGWVQLEFQNGTHVIIEGPTRVMVNDLFHIFCRSGRVSVEVPPDVTGFTVSTPFSRFVDRGTAFIVDVNQERSELEVVQGRVDAVWSNETPAIPLVKNEGIKVDTRQSVQRYTPDTSRSRYIPDTLFQSRLTDYVEKQLVDRNKRNQIVDNQPNLMVRFDFIQADKTRIANSSVRGSSLVPYASILHCRFDEGRFNTTKSVCFSQRGDAIVFDMNRKYQSMTLVANIRLDRFDNYGNVLFCSGNLTKVPGSFLWQIVKDGRIQFQIWNPRENTNQGEQIPEEYFSEAYFSPKLRGTWIQVAVVVDARLQTITHYIDGKKRKSAPWNAPCPLAVERGTLGNFDSTMIQKNSRYLGGAIDEFYFFDKALSTREIRDLAAEN